MSDLPKGWAETSLGEVSLDIIGGGTPSKSNLANFDGKIPFMTVKDMNVLFPSDTKDMISDVALANSSAKLIPAGTNVIATRMGLGKAVRPIVDVAINQDLKAIFQSDAINVEFLHWKLIASENYFLERGTGTTVKGVRLDDVRGLPIDLPPLPEQRLIVAKVNRLTARTARARKELDRIPTLIARYKQRLLELATSGKLTADWRLKHDLPNPEIGELSDLAIELRYGSSSKSLGEGKVPVLRMGNIQNGKLDWKDLKYTSDRDEIEKFRLLKGDVLFNRTNSPQLVGKTALFDGEREAIFAGYLIRVRCGPSLMPEFLTFCLNSPSGRAYSWDVKTDGVSQSNINAKKLAAFTLLLPSMEEQAEIVRRIETAFSWLDRIAADHAAAARLLPKLDAAILAKAFRGELVPQDPNDEPASALLDRVTKDRASYEAVKSSSQRNRKAKARTPRKAKVRMTKSRHDPDVWQQPYLTELLRKTLKTASAEDLFASADLELVDFYHQLSTEYENGWLVEADGLVKAA